MNESMIRSYVVPETARVEFQLLPLDASAAVPPPVVVSLLAGRRFYDQLAAVNSLNVGLHVSM